ncbi:MAG: hypothetical protein DLM62_21290 [Pseudonocardiales bacterium]|nr:MAG: hypothetical protein DLM62_21290 [Pseudonocardiales bacterium]
MSGPVTSDYDKTGAGCRTRTAVGVDEVEVGGFEVGGSVEVACGAPDWPGGGAPDWVAGLAGEDEVDESRRSKTSPSASATTPMTAMASRAAGEGMAGISEPPNFTDDPTTEATRQTTPTIHSGPT